MTDHRPGGRAPRVPDAPRPPRREVLRARRAALTAIAQLVALRRAGAEVDRELRAVAMAAERGRR